MLHVELPAARLAEVRFATSPMGETSMAMMAGAVPGSRAGRPARHAIKERLPARPAEFPVDRSGGIPEFRTPWPVPPREPAPDRRDATAATPAERSRPDLAVFLTDGSRPGAHRTVGGGTVGRPEHPDRESAERFASELERLWRQVVAPRWPSLERAMEADITRRADVMARHGVGAVFAGVDRALSWSGGAVHIDTRHEGRIAWSPSLVLVPSVIADRLGLFIDVRRRSVMLAYPIGDAAPAPVPAPSLSGVLGPTKLALLRTLTRARTTSELALLHHLTASSVSYHLTRLHAAGLLLRRRAGRAVYYRCSARALHLLDGAGEPSR